jgi:glycosyltransferase involved in cell wall biosynthesis
MSEKPHRVAIVTGLPAPYREPVFEALAQRPEVVLRVFYAARSHSDVGWKGDSARQFRYDRVFVSNATPRAFQRWPVVGYANFGLVARLEEFRPDYLIVYGYNQIYHWIAFRYAISRSVPFALRSDSNVHLDRATTWRAGVRRRLVLGLVRRAHAVLTVGEANRGYWASYGARPEQIFPAPYAVDNQRIARLAGRRGVRENAGPRLIYVGRLVRRKALDVLLATFDELADPLDLTLTVVGDGPERRRWAAMQSPAARDRTAWLGKLSNDEAIRAMSESDLFVLPSRYEPWGLVVNEAMAAGLPVVAHRCCGAAVDLIVPGETGWIVEDVSTAAFAETLRAAAADPERLAQMGCQAQARVQRWSIERTVAGMAAAVEDACGAAPSRMRRGAHV